MQAVRHNVVEYISSQMVGEKVFVNKPSQTEKHVYLGHIQDQCQIKRFTEDLKWSELPLNEDDMDIAISTTGVTTMLLQVLHLQNRT